MLLSPWKIIFFGGLRVEVGSSVATRFKTSKTGELLAFLAFFNQSIHRREDLATRLWPNVTQPTALASLRTALASLRRQLETHDESSIIIASVTSIQVNRGAFETDIGEFERLLQAAATNQSPNKISLLTRAVDLYGGEFLSGYQSGWIDPERLRYAELHRNCRLQLVLALEAAGQIELALFHGQHLVKIDPGGEDTHHALMRLYAASGEPAGALRQYRTLSRILKRDSKSAPSRAVTDLAHSLRRNPGAVIDRPLPLPAKEACAAVIPKAEALPREYRFPIPVSAFFGREREIAQIIGLFRGKFRASVGDVRTIVITGSGGIGKTRLVLEIAKRFSEEYHAVYFVSLAGVTTTEQVLDALLHILGEKSIPSKASQEQVIKALQRRPSTLLILDNFEQLFATGVIGAPNVNSSVALVNSLLETVTGLSCLITSRRPLGIQSERTVALSPLPVPAPEWEMQRIRHSPSVQLFVEHVRARKVDFAITERNAPVIAQICAELEGIPLAIELAAPRAYQVPVSDMLRLLQNKLDFLKEDNRSKTGRHSTMRSTISWGYHLLAPEEQRLFARLSLFDGWNRLEAEAVFGEDYSDRVAEELRRHSLIQEDTLGRFRMLDVVREFAIELFDETEAAFYRDRHASYFFELARQAITASRDSDQALWLDRLEDAESNLRVALHWTIGSEMSLRIANALHHFWYVRGRLNEGDQWMRRVLTAMPDAPDNLRSGILNGLGVFASARRDHAEAERLLSESLRLRIQMGDRYAEAALRNNLGTTAQLRGDLTSAHSHLRQSVLLYQELGRSVVVAHALSNLASVAIDMGNIDEADELISESLSISTTHGDSLGIGNNLQLQGILAFNRDAIDEAELYFLRCLETRATLKDQRFLPGLLAWFAAIAARRGMAQHGARLFAAASALRERIGSSLSPIEEARLLHGIDMTRQRLSGDDFSIAWEEGFGMSLEQAVNYAQQYRKIFLNI